MLLRANPTKPCAEIAAATAANPNSSPYCTTAAAASLARARRAGSAVTASRIPAPTPTISRVTAAAMSHGTPARIRYPQVWHAHGHACGGARPKDDTKQFAPQRAPAAGHPAHVRAGPCSRQVASALLVAL